MILELDENYRIKSDSFNFILQKRTNPEKGPKKRKGKILNKTGGWKDEGYWKQLDQALLSYTRQRLRDSSADGVEEVCRLLETLTIENRAIGERCVDLWGKISGRNED